MAEDTLCAALPEQASVERASVERASVERASVERERPALPSKGGLSAAIRQSLGRELRAFYDLNLSEPLPMALLDLIAKLDCASAATGSYFRADLLAALPGLRAFAVSLAVSPTAADDLVQETLLKAWANQHRFEPGSNLKAWLCTILRNQFYTDCRKRRREVEDADGALAGQLQSAANQEASSDLRRVGLHLTKLPPAMREALLMVAGQGLTYEAAAELIGCQTGTVKSRVSRGRALLARSLGMDLHSPAG